MAGMSADQREDRLAVMAANEHHRVRQVMVLYRPS